MKIFLNHLLLVLFLILPPTVFADNKKLIFGSSKANGFLPIIALNEGFLKQLGLELELKAVTTGKIAADAVSAGDFDACILIDSSISYLGFSDTNLRIVAELGDRAVDSIVFKNKLNIRVPNDLVGKRIGYTPGSASHIFLARFLDKNSISWSDIKPISVQPQAMNIAFKNGLVDAVSVFPPWSTHIEIDFKDEAGSFESNKSIYPSRLYLASTEKVINSRKNELQLLLNSFKLSHAFYKKNPLKTIQYLSKEFGVPANKVMNITEKYNYDFKNNADSLPFIYELGKWIKESQDSFKNLPLPDYKKYFMFDSLE